MRFRKTTSPRKLTLSEMWELSRILKGNDAISILKNTHPGLIYHAILILYGSAKNIRTGAHLIIYLDDGLKANHYQEFLATTKGH